MLAAHGRVIVSGMGKSGHVARKVAATLASTGTPALFVHPAEASHGDLGMITGDDVVLLLELGRDAGARRPHRLHPALRHPADRGGAEPESTLLRQSDVAIVLPKAPEACSVGLAPTTSTTMTLALGDALAVALMEHRRFTPEDLAASTPAGGSGRGSPRSPTSCTRARRCR